MSETLCVVHCMFECAWYVAHGACMRPCEDTRAAIGAACVRMRALHTYNQGI